MRKKGMGKAAAVIAAAMLFSLFSEAGIAAPQMVQAATYQKTIKNKSVKKPEVLVGADKVKVFSIKVKEIGKQIQEAETTEPSDDTKNQDGESAQQEEKTTEITEKTETTDITTETTEENEGIQISNDVIAVIAGVAVSEVQGVSSMAGGFAGGISEVLSGKKNLAKGIKVDKEENKVKIDVNIIVEYGTRIPDVAFEIQNRVKTSVENMTGLKVEEVNVHVQGVNTNTVSKEETEQNEEEKEQAE